MFEAQVLLLLRKYLGEYVHGLSTEALRISVWKGDVVLKDLKLKAEALNSLRLPISVKAGFVGTITLKVPWKSLGKQPVIVLIDKVFVLAQSFCDEQIVKEGEKDNLFKIKLHQIEVAERATLEAKSKKFKQENASGGNSWLSSLIGTIIGNLKITISNVHIRYEDTTSNVGHPFCCGVTLAKLAAVTTDDEGREIFDTSGALDKLRKSLQLERLAVYHDSNSLPWVVNKNWGDLNPREWMEIFVDGIEGSASDSSVSSLWALNRTYLVCPINGLLKYHRLGEQDRKDSTTPFEKASLYLSDISVTMSEAQYHDMLKFLEAASRFKTRIEVFHLRPVSAVANNVRAWWRYAMQACLQQKNIWCHMSWNRIRYFCGLRRRYIQLYVDLLRQPCNINNSAMREIERCVDPKVILLWRLLAHAKVETQEAAHLKVNLKRSWWSFGWRSSGDLSDANIVIDQTEHLENERLTKEEWEAFNKLLSYQPSEEPSISPGSELQSMMHLLVEIFISQGAAHIIGRDKVEIVCGRFEELLVVSKKFLESVHCDISLKFYGLTAPEGPLVESVSSEKKKHALYASFLYSPGGENMDWDLSAKIAPCYVTVLMGSMIRFIAFIKSSHDISPTVASETAAVLQIKIEEVSRKAQEQFHSVLEEQSRFALDIDFDAPKVRIPLTSNCSCEHSYFLLDCGHFTLKTRSDDQSLYSRFYISGGDFAAFFMDGGPAHAENYFPAVISNGRTSIHLSSEDSAAVLYCLVDRCGVAVVIDQIKIRRPGLPSRRIFIQIPSLAVHLSPERYSRLLALFDILYVKTKCWDQEGDNHLKVPFASRLQADLASRARILIWRGIGNTIAEWRPCFLLLSGIYLYVLESEMVESYQRCSSMAGRQIFVIPPANVDGSLYCIAVCFRGVDVQKALESSNSLIIEFHSDEEQALWLKALTRASHKASSSRLVDDGLSNHFYQHKANFTAAPEVADLVLHGVLFETKLYIYGKLKEHKHETCEMLQAENQSLEELVILDVLAESAKINLACMGGNFTLKSWLQSLRVRDELQGRLGSLHQYFACSVVKESCPDLQESFESAVLDEGEVFKDALSDCSSATDLSTDLIDAKGSVSVGDSSLCMYCDQMLENLTTISSVSDADSGRSSDFICVSFMSRASDTPLYDSMDAQMCVRMTGLEFFCNRPTIIALIDFGIDMSHTSSGLNYISEENVAIDGHGINDMEESVHTHVKGLLGYGKDRVVFRLLMDVDTVCIYLNKEDDTQLGMFIQDRFVLDTRIYPSSLSIEGSLGNLRLCDMSLPHESYWGWLCDLRSEETESLIKFIFQSYSTDDDDYDGYDYCLRGHLSAVRIVFLYRFVQEIIAYFMELATPHTEGVIKFVDRVGGFDWLIHEYEMEGSSSIKLDLCLDTPIIVVPQHSLSKDFIQLDLGQLHIVNEFSWHGCPETDPSAVHLGILLAVVHGINMVVGINGQLGKFMVREAEGFKIEVRHALRDIFKKIPSISLDVKVDLLHGVVSDKEYSVVVDCLYSNLWEPPNLPPSFRGNISNSKESMRMIFDKMNVHSQALLSRTTSVISVEIKSAFLELCNEPDESSPLARLSLESLWVSYRTTSLSEIDLYVTVSKFSVLDARSQTLPEMRLMLGSSSEPIKQTLVPVTNFSNNLPGKNDSEDAMKTPKLTMLLFDYRVRSRSCASAIRIQQLRVLVVLDFLIALCEYFVPSIRAVTGSEKLLEPANDPLRKNGHVVLCAPVHVQQEEVVHLSPARKLIVDAHGIDEFVYDGRGRRIHLCADSCGDDLSSAVTSPIVIIGRGKNLRFKNVKIENGSLLRRFTYLGDDSSYSILEDDAVEISYMDTARPLADSNISDHLGEPSGPVMNSSSIIGDAHSVTFDAQVVMSEFTFCDTAKLCCDDSWHVEKLLRAKIDLGFMFASKGRDKWSRVLLKDLAIETGSGLVVLDPVDLSAGYACVKGKVNLSIALSEIYVHLPLSAISLVLHLHHEATKALKFGDIDPLVACVNFDCVWMSKGGNSAMSFSDISFWRPQPPPGYAILGDCVSSRTAPPSHAVMAVSNIYGRVKKPHGFEPVVSFSSFELLEGNDSQDRIASSCSLWLPIAPEGYSALGCVVNVGSQPPSTDIVYCLRSDLVASTTFLDCCLAVSPNSRFISGFSIWRVDNAVGSFFAHRSLECPPKLVCCDLSQILLRYSSLNSPLETAPSSYVTYSSKSPNEREFNHLTSGHERSRSITKSSAFCRSTLHFERIWWDKGGEFRRPVSVWRPMPRLGFSILGDCICQGLEPPASGLLFRSDGSAISARPVQFIKVAHAIGKGVYEAFFWYPVAPPGYVSLGCVVSRTDETPSLDILCCPRVDLVHQSYVQDAPISRSSLKGSLWSIWKVENLAGSFIARSDLKKPSKHLAYNVGEYAEPRHCEDINAELKLSIFSVTILDSMYGMMTPVFDVTIVDVNLATHGGPESMNAVLISSIAASTFNQQLEAWEPLVEPFDAIFKLETYSSSAPFLPRCGKHVQITATNNFNVNVSAANVCTITQTLVSWRKQAELDLKSAEEVGIPLRRGDQGAVISALDEDEFQKVAIENKLGCDVYLKTFTEDSEKIALLKNDECTCAWIPPPSVYDKLNVSQKSFEPRCYIGVHMLEAKGLPVVDDGSKHNFFCSLRLVIDDKSSDRQLIFPQSARTRSINNAYADEETLDSVAKWNELFLFEIPKKGSASLEAEVTNLSLHAGKGEVIGSASIALVDAVSKFQRASSLRLLHQPVDVQRFSAYPLKKRGLSAADAKDGGWLMVSISYFEKKRNVQREGMASDNDVGFLIGLQPHGPWESIRALLPSTTLPRVLNDDPFASEISMKNGKKHVRIRSLAMLVNEADIQLEISVCPMLTITNSMPTTKTKDLIIDEVFENERCHPFSSWGSKLPECHVNDPPRWSTRDFSYSSKDFFEPDIPPGWRSISDWVWEKSEYVDNEGWAYGPDFQSLRWPPSSSMSSAQSPKDFVRRRRWIRPREMIVEDQSCGSIAIILKPKETAFLPWKSMAKDSHMCLQVRPYGELHCLYTWGHVVAVDSYASQGSEHAPTDYSNSRQNTPSQSLRNSISVFDLSKIEKKDVLLKCNSANSDKLHFWISVGSDATILHTESNSPVYDWKLSFNAPLKLENKLPYQTEYSIWEKMKGGNRIQRQHGVISSSDSVFVYSADLQKPIYLTLFCQGGWMMEKDSVLILDISSSQPVSSFWMIHQKSKRRLRIYFECDTGGTTAATKTVRLFVPYWIANESLLPLVYQMVEVDCLESTNPDKSSISKAVKSAKLALKRPNISCSRMFPSSKKVLRVLEVIEEMNVTQVMLSPQEYLPHSNASSFPSHCDSFLSPRVGISVGLYGSNTFSPGISLLELENKERADVKAFHSNGFYYKLFAHLSVVSNRIKVIHFLPQTVFINRTGCTLWLQQCDAQTMILFRSFDSPKIFMWNSACRTEMLKLRLDGFQWSAPFSINIEGIISVRLTSELEDVKQHVRVEVRNGAKHSCYEVIFRPTSFTSPFRVENYMFSSLNFRQVDGGEDSWTFLPPNAATSFCWGDLGRKRLLEVLVDGNDPLDMQSINIEENAVHIPGNVSKMCGNMRISLIKEGKTLVVKIRDQIPAINSMMSLSSKVLNLQGVDEPVARLPSEFHVVLELAEIGISFIDHTPEEILYLNLQNLTISYSCGLASGISRLKVRIHGVQVDNQLPLTSMPVLFCSQRTGSHLDCLLKLSITMQSSGTVDTCVYPYVGLQGPENSAFVLNIHEPIIWRLHELIQHLKPAWFLCSYATAVSVDPTVNIGLLNISEIRFKVSVAMSPTQRPRGVLGFWSSLMTALGNIENMPVRINQRFHEDICMHRSALIISAISNIHKDLLSQPLQLLSGVDILGNASSALGHMSKGVAALSMDEKFIQSRQKQEIKGIDDIGDVIREGGGAFAKGLFRGVTGILTKPLEGAKNSGIEGFVQGVGKGIIGAAAQPVSGVLDLLSKTTEGANAVRMRISSAITSEEQSFRRRLPRVIGADSLVRPYDAYRAEGQAILHLAESGAFFGQGDIFKVRGKFALSDAYEDHFLLPKGRIVVVTHRRVLLLQQPANVMIQKKFNPAREPCTVMWDVSWEILVMMELVHGRNDNSSAPPSRLILYLLRKSLDSKDTARVIKCRRNTEQAFEIYHSIDRVIKSFGPKRSKEFVYKVQRPYSPCSSSVSSEGDFAQANNCMWDAKETVGVVQVGTSFGMALGQPQYRQL